MSTGRYLKSTLLLFVAITCVQNAHPQTMGIETYSVDEYCFSQEFKTQSEYYFSLLPSFFFTNVDPLFSVNTKNELLRYGVTNDKVWCIKNKTDSSLKLSFTPLTGLNADVSIVIYKDIDVKPLVAIIYRHGQNYNHTFLRFNYRCSDASNHRLPSAKEKSAVNDTYTPVLRRKGFWQSVVVDIPVSANSFFIEPKFSVKDSLPLIYLYYNELSHSLMAGLNGSSSVATPDYLLSLEWRNGGFKIVKQLAKIGSSRTKIH